MTGHAKERGVSVEWTLPPLEPSDTPAVAGGPLAIPGSNLFGLVDRVTID